MKNVPQEQIVALLRAENPWWDEDKSTSPAISGLRPRPYLELFLPLVRNRKVHRAVVLMGPRRVGKTVLIHHAIQDLLDTGTDPKRICYVSVDKPLYNGLSLEELLGLYEASTEVDYRSEECFVFFDEIQYLRDWEIHLKAIVDQYTSLKCTASGSAAAALRLRSHESGAGRFTDFLLPPLTFHEYLFLLGKEDIVTISESHYKTAQNFATDISTRNIDRLNEHFVNYLNFGGYPEVALSEEIQKDPSRFVKSDIIDKVLLRDLPSLYGIQDVQELNHLFTTLAYNTAGEISLEKLSQRSGVGKNTIKRYIEYLEAAFLIRIVHRVDRNAKRFKRANFFKVYLTNPSIWAALFSPVDPSNKEAMGALVETAIFSQWFHSDALLHYARWKGGEVDIVHLDSDQSVAWAIEVKWSDRYLKRPEELGSLIKFCHTHNLSTATVTTIRSEGYVTFENINLEFRPASLHCYMLGFNMIRHRQRRIGI